jgi:hypothetical protein
MLKQLTPFRITSEMYASRETVHPVFGSHCRVPLGSCTHTPITGVHRFTISQMHGAMQ